MTAPGDYLLIYGARIAGRQVRDYLLERGQTVHGFLDRDPALREVDGLPVVCAEAWAQEHDSARARVVIGLFNSHVDVGDIVDRLERLGYGDIVSLVEFVRRYPQGQPFRYWLVQPDYYLQHAPRIARFRARLADETSRQLLDRIVRFRTTGDYRCLPPPDARQYFPDDLPAWPQPLRFIDCGAYTGDTVQAMREGGMAFEAIATFEPNLDNYRLLVENLRNEPATHFPCGVSDSNRLSGFDSGTGQGGHLVEEGGEPVFCVRLDDAIPGFAPNLIKMDIEGEEPAALRGAQDMLRTHRPNLAISVYHRAEHLWEIFEQLHGYGLGYDFHLRCHAYSSFETVLYAMRVPHA
ncbi:FkbM family methyltransferase [Stutzerimonas kirkiae]|uniref:FkbM family methyltransferase n=1 Tax=Stutzerimonas kirkiae TaxID=2211392 RepID=A0A4Q9RE57_9GAMM|nr:FkbM family methyltransferase [Stutzerimonas kirkiae]TBU99968.1 FkbM family methyltransferase [Stutzerimonas kirkiae]TBV05674.1 FkbM family methyltransferase [Stutzerimonas kirkiae]TBV10583.1 FkbM family methyltransferase [Stutzerimonas kirkiae]